MINHLLFIISVVLPVFLLVIIGVILKQIKIVDDIFIKSTSYFVFHVSLPVLIFMKLYDLDIHRAFDTRMIIIVISGTILTFFMGLIVAKYSGMEPQNEGVFIQGSFRGNYAIVGLAIIIRMFGSEVAGKATFLLLFILPLFNLLSIIALTIPHIKSNRLHLKKIMIEIMTNPLLIAVAVAILYSFLNIGLHQTLKITGNYLADTALPIALIGIGGSFNIASLKQASGAALGASFIKNIFSPFIIVFISYYSGMRGSDLGVIFVIFACPTAIASFIMAAGMKGNIKLAGNIIIVSTVASIFIIILGLFILTYFKLI